MKTLSTLVHQAVISVNTLLTTICLAHLLGSHAFGVFATCFAAFLVGLGLNRCIVTDPAIITSGELEAPSPGAILYLMLTRRRSWLLITATTTLLWLGAAIVTDHRYLLVAAVGAPCVMAADTLRYLNIAMGRKRQAMQVDAVQLVVTVSAAALTLALVQNAALFLFLAWIVGPVVAIVSTAPRHVRSEPGDLRPSSALVRGLLIDYLAQTGLTQLALLGVALVVSVTAVGELRLVQTLFGVFAVVVQAIASLGLASMVQARRADEASLPAATRRASAVALTLATVNFAVVYLLPLSVLELIVGDGAAGARELAPWMYAVTITQSLAIAPMMRLRVSGNVRSILRVRRFTAAGELILPIALASVLGAQGALAGVTIVTAMVVVLATIETRSSRSQAVPA